MSRVAPPVGLASGDDVGLGDGLDVVGADDGEGDEVGLGETGCRVLVGLDFEGCVDGIVEDGSEVVVGVVVDAGTALIRREAAAST